MNVWGKGGPERKACGLPQPNAMIQVYIHTYSLYFYIMWSAGISIKSPLSPVLQKESSCIVRIIKGRKEKKRQFSIKQPN